MKANWAVGVEGRQYLVSVQTSGFFNAGKLFMDGKLIDTWECSWWTRKIPFSIEGKPALLRHAVSILGRERPELYVDGVPVPRAR